MTDTFLSCVFFVMISCLIKLDRHQYWENLLWNWSGLCNFLGLVSQPATLRANPGEKNMCTCTESRGITSGDPLESKDECCNEDSMRSSRSELGRFFNGILRRLLQASGPFLTLPLTEVTLSVSLTYGYINYFYSSFVIFRD